MPEVAAPVTHGNHDRERRPPQPGARRTGGDIVHDLPSPVKTRLAPECVSIRGIARTRAKIASERNGAIDRRGISYNVSSSRAAANSLATSGRTLSGTAWPVNLVQNPTKPAITSNKPGDSAPHAESARRFRYGRQYCKRSRSRKLFLELVLTWPIQAFEHLRNQDVHELSPRSANRLPHSPAGERPTDQPRKLFGCLCRRQIRMIDAKPQNRVIGLPTRLL